MGDRWSETGHELVIAEAGRWVHHTILSTSVFILSDYYIVTQPTATMNQFFQNLVGSHGVVNRSGFPFFRVILFKSVSLIQKKQIYYLEEISILPCSLQYCSQ